MSKLIQLRQRSKAIETIKKITHAMRLISMSSHSHLQRLQDSMARYSQNVDTLFSQLRAYAPEWDNPVTHPQSTHNRIAIILIGSQKGLCGSFNTHLFKYFSHHISDMQFNPSLVDIIPVGQKMTEALKGQTIGTIKQSYEKFSAQRLEPIAREIARQLINNPVYKSVLIFSNLFQSFFIQKPHQTVLLPLEPLPDHHIPPKNDWEWEQTPCELLDTLLPQYIESKLQALLFQSLIAEHAARFISMDSATRNAKNLLEANNLECNKLRQAKITKELTELIGSYK